MTPQEEFERVWFYGSIIGLGWTLFTPILVMFLTPGKRGFPRVERSVNHEMSVDQACQLYAQRLAFEGFTVDLSGAPFILAAQRGKGFVSAHANKPLSVVGQFAPDEHGGVAVTIALRMNDFVLRDTGEWRFTEQMFARIMDADLEAEEAPAVPNSSYSVEVALYAAAFVWVAGGLMLHRYFIGPRALGLLAAVGQTAAVGIALAGYGILEILRKPKEVTGKSKAIVAIVLIIAGAGVALLMAIEQNGKAMFSIL